jgi:hypothetical protein
MANRINDLHLTNLVNRLNNLTGNNTDQWSMKDGKNTANVGSFYISHAYGGVALMQMCNESGGVNMPLMQGHTTKRDCYDQVYAFIKGIEYAKQGK